MELRQSFILELRDQVNDPSFRNYEINTFVELRQSFLLELWDQHIYGNQAILPFGITGFMPLWSY